MRRGSRRPAPAAGPPAAWLLERSGQPGPVWTGQRGRLSASGVTQVVLAVGATLA